jgi:hypothetical protein
MTNKSSALDGLNWSDVARHFRNRVKVSGELLRLHDDKKVDAYAELAIGYANTDGNYSASEHPVLLSRITENRNWQSQVYELATRFRALTNACAVPGLINEANLNSLKISVGSEISCMVNPDVCWVCNVRTIWLHLAWTKSPEEAERALRLFREGASDSEMAYSNWADEFHPLLSRTLVEVGSEGRSRARAEWIPREQQFLWADAVASYAYGAYHGE